MTGYQDKGMGLLKARREAGQRMGKQGKPVRHLLFLFPLS